ncbi:ADP-sugar pyrophosphatase isoform X2 [Latimeria chalumnae]|uniref:ADP-sugar pyrophosphatase isoform X2 n=1 Tax=Latimeria chalumnae TaxID=7897 RepID=UPI00313CC2D0
MDHETDDQSAKNTKEIILKEEVIAKGNWVKLEQTAYVDPTGKTRTWETVKRTTRQENATSDGVAVFAVLKRTLHYDCVVLVKQFRPPMGQYCLEFPAGLMDNNECAEDAALRELLEETGYKGEVTAVSPAVCLDPGLTNCTSHLVTVTINGDDPDNIKPKQNLPDGGMYSLSCPISTVKYSGRNLYFLVVQSIQVILIVTTFFCFVFFPFILEFVEVVLLPLNELLKKIDEIVERERIVVDARVYIFAMGLTQATLKPSVLPVLKT